MSNKCFFCDKDTDIRSFHGVDFCRYCDPVFKRGHFALPRGTRHNYDVEFTLGPRPKELTSHRKWRKLHPLSSFAKVSVTYYV